MQQPIQWLLIALFSSSASLFAQTLPADSVLNHQAYLQQIANAHPMVQQAQLMLTYAAANLDKSKGAFDPQLVGNWDEKQFKDKQYFRYLDAGIEVPTRSPFKFKGGYAQTQGIYLNPEANLPDQGLWSMGLEVALGKGLLTDVKRTEYRLAQQLIQQNEVGVQNVLNELSIQATEAYLEWELAYSQLAIWEEAIILAEERMEGLRKSAAFGDKAGIDTVEAYLVLLDRQLGYQTALLTWQNSSQVLGNFLWGDSLTNRAETVYLQPIQPTLLSRNASPTFAIGQHPQMRSLGYDGQMLATEARWKREQLKPTFTVRYNVLQEPVRESIPFPNPQNAKWGVQFSFPLFLRKERAGVAMNQIKQDQLDQKQRQKEVELLNKREQYIQQKQTYEAQARQYRLMVQGYEQLLTAEKNRFEAGESTLFLINSRESKLIEARLQLRKMETLVLKSAYRISWAEGTLWTVLF